METSFTPITALAGGLLIGLSAVFLMASLGRIMGATGVLGGLLLPAGLRDFTWRAVLLFGMICAPLLLAGIGQPVMVNVPVSTPMLVIGGLLVGFGATIGSGCTSGHGVCGIARLSPRSIVATLTFMATTAATVYVLRHVIGA